MRGCIRAAPLGQKVHRPRGGEQPRIFNRAIVPRVQGACGLRQRAAGGRPWNSCSAPMWRARIRRYLRRRHAQERNPGIARVGLRIAAKVRPGRPGFVVDARKPHCRVAATSRIWRIAARAAVLTRRVTRGKIMLDSPKRQLDARQDWLLGQLLLHRPATAGQSQGLGRGPDIVIQQSKSTRTALLLANMSLCAIDVAGSFCPGRRWWSVR